mmetsp:Transcript_53095/g.126926  ORF Transcript_53095/g.126926 Transcript_53095/m.126926 type:complete len:278 (-) Transcript_53095:2563-3396(-)
MTGSTTRYSERSTSRWNSFPWPLPLSSTVMLTLAKPCQFGAGLNCSRPGPVCMLLKFSTVVLKWTSAVPISKQPSSLRWPRGSSICTPSKPQSISRFPSWLEKSSNLKLRGCWPASISLTNSGPRTRYSSRSSLRVYESRNTSSMGPSLTPATSMSTRKLELELRKSSPRSSSLTSALKRTNSSCTWPKKSGGGLYTKNGSASFKPLTRPSRWHSRPGTKLLTASGHRTTLQSPGTCPGCLTSTMRNKCGSWVDTCRCPMEISVSSSMFSEPPVHCA